MEWRTFIIISRIIVLIPINNKSAIIQMTIWIDPQEVSCRFGSDSKIYQIYEHKEGVDIPWTGEIIKKENPCNILSCFN